MIWRGSPLGLQAFAPNVTSRGTMFSARSRAKMAGETPPQPAGVSEADLS